MKKSISTIAILATAGAVAGLANAAPPPGLDQRPQNLGCIAPARPPNPFGVDQQVHDMTFGSLFFVPHPGNDAIWYGAWHAGKIFRFEYDGTTLSSRTEVLDIRDRTATWFDGTLYAGMGLVGIAFDPEFATNRHVYLYYGYAENGHAPPLVQRLSRFTFNEDLLTIDTQSEDVLLSLPQQTSQHKGGDLRFGTDGYLYLSIGDDENLANAQDTSSLEGALIRIDVSGQPGYGIPADNPFAVSGGRPEIFAWGFRNPWRWSFDALTQDLWLGDVGAATWEEINRVQLGENHGWGVAEGFGCYQNANCDQTGLTQPTGVFPNLGAAAVIGGYVYRGSELPALDGAYIFADGPKGIVYGLFQEADNTYQRYPILSVDGFIVAFGEDSSGELWISTQLPHSVIRLVAADDTGQNQFPDKLSETGCVNIDDPHSTPTGLIPYGVASSLWSDGAHKTRFIAMPDWLSPESTISVEPDGDFVFPIGTVLVKHFEINSIMVETRLLILHDDGEWSGYSYEWNEQQSDATLLNHGKTKFIEGQTWEYPSRPDCLQCHTEVAGRTLGLEIAQQNSDFYYDVTGRTANQFDTFRTIGVFSEPLAPSDQQPAVVDPADSSLPLNERARSYLHANCSMCHRPGGPGNGPEDFRYHVEGVDMGASDIEPVTETFGIPNAKLLAPGEPERSIISYRMHVRGTQQPGQMPPLATALVDADGTALIDDWIRSGLGFGIPDTDADGFADHVDNCTLATNPTQLDANDDGIGNACDADLTNDCVVNFADLAALKTHFLSDPYNEEADLNGNGVVNFSDLAIMKASFITSPTPGPGPGKPGNICDN